MTETQTFDYSLGADVHVHAVGIVTFTNIRFRLSQHDWREPPAWIQAAGGRFEFKWHLRIDCSSTSSDSNCNCDGNYATSGIPPAFAANLGGGAAAMSAKAPYFVEIDARTTPIGEPGFKCATPVSPTSTEHLRAFARQSMPKNYVLSGTRTSRSGKALIKDTWHLTPLYPRP
jgi:hypothetical protein